MNTYQRIKGNEVSKAQHTPGPWLRYGNEILNEKDGFAIAKVICFNDYHESDANTKLISAAPELLEAIQDLLEEYEGVEKRGHDGCLVRKVRAAIAKAEGE